VSGNENHGNAGISLADLLERLQPGRVAEVHIKNNDIRRYAIEDRQSLRRGRGGDERVFRVAKRAPKGMQD
jgi:hypothetical protein